MIVCYFKKIYSLYTLFKMWQEEEANNKLLSFTIFINTSLREKNPPGYSKRNFAQGHAKKWQPANL